MTTTTIARTTERGATGGTSDPEVRRKMLDLASREREVEAAKVWHGALVQDLLAAEEAYAYDLRTGGLTTATTSNRCADARRALDHWFTQCLYGPIAEITNLVDRWGDAS